MYLFESRIRFSETDSEGRLTLSGLLNYFQDCSTFQSEDIGLGLSYMQERKLAWVVSSWQIVTDRYPLLGERVKIGTLPYGFRSFMGYRNFFMQDEAGNYLAKANSLWALISLETGRPVPALPEMLEGYRAEEKLQMEYADRRIAVPGDGVPAEPITVGPHLLDSNRHVNNGQYVTIAESFLPRGRAVRQMRAEYKKQAFLGDVFYPYITEREELFLVSLKDREGKVYATVEFLADKAENG